MSRVLYASVVVLALAVAGCPSNNQVILPGPGSLPQVVYVAAFGPSNLAIIALPVTNASVPVYVTPSGMVSVVQLTLDTSQNLWGVNDIITPGSATGYVRPVTSASTPFAAVTIPSPAAPDALAFDSHGNLWVADGDHNKVFEFTGPFSGSSAPAPAVTLTGFVDPDGLAFDAAGNLYVSNVGTGTVLIFNPPFSNGQSPTGSPITGLDLPLGLTFDASGNLYIANFGNGSIARKNAPTAGGGAVDITDTATTITTTEGLSFDALGNLYATDLQHAKLFVFPTATTAFSSSLAPSVTLTLSGFGASHTGGVVVGPP